MDDLFKAQSHLYFHTFSYISSMSLKCAIQLGVADAIHSHGKPITLPELVKALKIHPSKEASLYRLMRMLTHSGIFSEAASSSNNGLTTTCYELTPCSRILVNKDSDNTCLAPFVMAMLDPALLSPWQFLGDWLKGEDLNQNPFEMAHGVDLWGFGKQNPEFNVGFNKGMASDSGMINLMIKECKDVFQGLTSLVDVGGGVGTVAAILCEAFPGLNCTVLDLPHVVDGLVSSNNNMRFVAGDMFQHIPSADALLLKWMLHGWSDEDCVKILKKCREAIVVGCEKEEKRKKVIIIDIVISEEEEEEEQETSTSSSTKLYFDMLMMTQVNGKERTDKEWGKLFVEAGFTRYNITPVFGLRSLIEVYP